MKRGGDEGGVRGGWGGGGGEERRKGRGRQRRQTCQYLHVAHTHTRTRTLSAVSPFFSFSLSPLSSPSSSHLEILHVHKTTRVDIGRKQFVDIVARRAYKADPPVVCLVNQPKRTGERGGGGGEGGMGG